MNRLNHERMLFTGGGARNVSLAGRLLKVNRPDRRCRSVSAGLAGVDHAAKRVDKLADTDAIHFVKTAPLPQNESERLAALRRYDILDSLPEAAFDEITRLAAQIAGTPAAAINFLDEHRQWFKSRLGLDFTESPRYVAFCGFTILQDDVMAVEDTTLDDRFSDNPLVTGKAAIRFYAGMPLISPEGFRLGTLLVVDHVPQKLSEEKAEALRILSRQVMTQLELRRHLVELAHSVEDHKRTEEALRTSEVFYQTLVESLPQHILRKDLDGRFTFANKNFYSELGTTLEELVGKTDFDFFPPELAKKYHWDDLRVTQTRRTFDTIEAHQKPDGQKMFVHVIKTPLYDSAGNVVGIQGIFWDVTERKKMEEALAYERDLLRALLDTIPDRIYFKDVQSRFLRCSTLMARRLGLKDPKDVWQKTDFEFYPKDLAQEFYQDEQRIILTGHPLINKLEKLIDVDGRESWVSVTKVPIYNRAGGVTGIIGISRDVTKLKEAEAALEQARDVALESARAKSEFLANMSHEIRTPLNAIMGMTGLLLETQLDQEQREFAETVRTSTDALLAIINDILDFSKIEAGKFSFEVIDFELRESVENTVELMAERAQRKGVELACWLDQSVPNNLRGDPIRLRQILINLLSNAVKFTEKGEVVLHVTRVEERDREVMIRFTVTDTGIGIPTRALARIFEAFTQADGSTTRKYGGTGLGLAISKQLVELMGGELGVKSDAGQGSSFWFTLPFEIQTNPGAPPDQADLNILKGKRVLVVDDNETNRRILGHQLNRWDIAFALADGGPAALHLLRQGAGRGEPFDLAILDMQMPEMDGLTLASVIKEEPAISAIQLLMLTSLGHRLDASAMQSTGIEACLVKPVRQSRLFDALVSLLSPAGELGDRAVPGVAPLQPAQAKPSGKLRILLAEDNLVNQKLALRQLEKLGYAADAVGNGLQVIDALRRVPYDVILMDCQMPEMDGYEATQKIRQMERAADSPFKTSPFIIALTANALDGDRERCLAVGMNDYVTKPVQINQLRSALLKVSPPPVAPGDSDFPILDAEVVEGIRALREPGRPDPVAELIDLFLSDAAPRIRKMGSAIASGDALSLVSAAHSLKGSSSNLGARRLSDACARLEKLAKAKDFAGAQTVLPEVEEQFALIEQKLLKEREK